MNKLLIIYCLICLLIAVALPIYFKIVQKIEIRKEKKKEKQNAKIDKETLENINGIAGGDIHAGNDILHQLAEKRK